MNIIMKIFAALFVFLCTSNLIAATILVSSGSVNFSQSGEQIVLAKGSEIDAPFNVKTLADGYVQIDLGNGSIMSINQASSVEVYDSSSVKITSGGMEMFAGSNKTETLVDRYQLKADGFLRIRLCDTQCNNGERAHGSVVSGEAIIEYPGGRAVMRDKPFLLKENGKRPILMAKSSDLLSNNNQLSRAQLAKVEVTESYKDALDAFQNSRFDTAKGLLLKVKEMAPSQALASYYLGLSYLELGDKNKALEELQVYKKSDFSGAEQRKVGQLITVLLDESLQVEAKAALERESQASVADIEPNTIAVQAFMNTGNPKYMSLSKGIAAMIIADLNTVPGLTVLERQKVQKLMDEISLSQSGLVGEDAMVKAGRIMKAEKILFGSFGVEQ